MPPAPREHLAPRDATVDIVGDADPAHVARRFETPHDTGFTDLCALTTVYVARRRGPADATYFALSAETVMRAANAQSLHLPLTHLDARFTAGDFRALRAVAFHVSDLRNRLAASLAKRDTMTKRARAFGAIVRSNPDAFVPHAITHDSLFAAAALAAADATWPYESLAAFAASVATAFATLGHLVVCVLFVAMSATPVSAASVAWCAAQAAAHAVAVVDVGVRPILAALATLRAGLHGLHGLPAGWSEHAALFDALLDDKRLACVLHVALASAIAALHPAAAAAVADDSVECAAAFAPRWATALVAPAVALYRVYALASDTLARDGHHGLHGLDGLDAARKAVAAAAHSLPRMPRAATALAVAAAHAAHLARLRRLSSRAALVDTLAALIGASPPWLHSLTACLLDRAAA